MRIRGYIFAHLMEVFSGTLAVLYSVMFIVQWIRIGRAVSFRDIDILLLAMVPMSAFVIPMSLLFSILLVLERLSVESEIIAMKACGVRSATLYTPILLLAVACLLVHTSVSTYLGPLSMKKIQSDLVKEAPKKILAFLEEREFNDTFKDIVVYVEAVNQKQRQMKGIYIETSGREHAVITSESGTIDAARGAITMRLKNGSVFMSTRQTDRFLTFDEYIFTLEADLTSQLRIKSYDTATQPEFRRLIQDRPTPKRIKEYHNRLSFPVFNLVLGLIGMTFGIQRPRSPRFTGFIIGIGTVLGYYLAFVFADRLVKVGAMDPVLGAWLPNVVFAASLSLVWGWRTWGAKRRGGRVRIP